MTHVNKDAWDDLTDEQRQALLQAAKAANEAAWGALEQRVAQNYAEMKEHGMTVHQDVPEEFLSTLTEAGQPVIDDWLEDMGPDGQEILDAYFAMRDGS
jgi:TRAP-type C4-dicarboxylate transport system substrate-binding protein